MFSLLWGASEKAPANSCCGNREKGSVAALPIAPRESASVADEKPLEVEPEAPPVDDGGVGSMLPMASMKRMSQFGLQDTANPLDNLAAAMEQEEQTPSNGAEEVAFDGSARNTTKLASFEDRMDKAEADATGVDDNISDDSEDSDQERLKDCALAFREGQKKMASDAKFKDHEDGSAQEAVFLALQDQMKAMKSSGLIPTRGGPKGAAPKDAGPSLQRGASSASGVSAASATSGVSALVDSAEPRPQLLTMGTSMSLVSDGGGASQPLTEPSVMPPVTPGGGGEEEEEDEENENPDEEAVINRKYQHRYKDKTGVRIGLPDKVEQIRHLCIKMGDEEPPVVDQRSAVATKSRVLEVLFISRGDYDSEETKITFLRKPIGIKWDKRAPISIYKVKERGHGDELGVQQGMEIKEINGIDVTTLDYPHTYSMLMKAVNHLPDKAPPAEDAKSSLNAGMEGQVLTVRGRVTIEAANGFQNEDADHFVVCQVAGKPHSKVQTEPLCVNDTPETSDLCWDQMFDLFDYQRGDTIEFACYAQERVASKTGEDTSLGRARLTWEAVSSKGFHGELSLLDANSQMTKTKMRVKVEVDMVPEKQQAISTFRHIMRQKMLTLGVDPEKLKASFPEHESETTFTTASDAVRDALRGYHKHSETLGIFMPFPGMKENEGYAELEPDANKKLLEYNRKLNEDDPNRLWVNDPHAQHTHDAAAGRRGSVASAQSAGWAAMGSSIDVQVKPSRTSRVSVHMPHMPSLFSKHGAHAGGEENRTDPIGELEIVFETDHAAEQAVMFERSPIGIEFFHKMPLAVKAFKPDSLAEQKGVKKGWKIKRIDGKDLSKMWYKDASKFLFSNLDRLPKELG